MVDTRPEFGEGGGTGRPSLVDDQTLVGGIIGGEGRELDL
jgi:hypothetical protein